MSSIPLIHLIFLIFSGAAILATFALFTRQSLLVAYILLGILLGPSVLKLVPELGLTHQIGDMGITFLLFLLGLDLSPVDLLHTIRKTTLVTIFSSVIFIVLGFAVAYLFGFSWLESLLIGAALMFSSTIIGLKLLPTTVLHQQTIGELMVSVLLLQDLIAIALLVLVHSTSVTGSKLMDIGLTLIILPILLGIAFFLQHFIIAKLFRRFDKIKEYVFLLALGWCLSLAEVARLLGLPPDIGAFIAGVSIAEGPIASYIAESLQPLRDFCLVLFFFAMGASIDLHYLSQIWAPIILLAMVLLIGKPTIFAWLLQGYSESKAVAREVALRLGQCSEFSFLIAYFAANSTPALLSQKASYLIQATTALTFIVSSYMVVMRYSTPMSFFENKKLS